MLNERSQVQKPIWYYVDLDEIYGRSIYTETGSGIAITRGWQKGEG